MFGKADSQFNFLIYHFNYYLDSVCRVLEHHVQQHRKQKDQELLNPLYDDL